MHLHPVSTSRRPRLASRRGKGYARVDAGGCLERLHRDVLGAAVAAGGVVDLSGPALRERNELGDDFAGSSLLTPSPR